MFKVYDSNYKFLQLLDIVKNCYTTEQISTGTKNLYFEVPINDMNLKIIVEENYIESSDYNYVIKEVNIKNNNFLQVYCIANYEELSGIIFPTFDLFQLSLEDGYKYCLSQSEWEVTYNSTARTAITYQLPNVTAMEMIRQIAADNKQELWFDTKNKTLYVYDKMGKKLGNYYSNELNLQQLQKQSSSYEYATVLYPYGKDGLTIDSINGGRKFLTNYSYTDKYIEKVWIDESYEHPEDLMVAAKAYLEELAQPKSSYQLTLSSLGDVKLGDEIVLVDYIKRIKQKQRVVKIVHYPYEPEKDKVDISNLKEDFTTTYLASKKKMEADISDIKKILKTLVK